MDSPIPQFGIRHPGREYVVRPSAYLVLSSEEGKIAIVRTKRGGFLPGGGVRANESSSQAAARETLEECGLQVENLVEIGRADQFVYSEPERTFFLKRCTFFRGRLTATGPSIEADHHLEWVAYGDALRILSHESQRWAVSEERGLTRA